MSALLFFMSFLVLKPYLFVLLLQLQRIQLWILCLLSCSLLSELRLDMDILHMAFHFGVKISVERYD